MVVENLFIKWSCGKMAFFDSTKKFLYYLKKADIVLHAPGGPSIGDTYFDDEITYLRTYDLVASLKIPYMFYAPSMGPFDKKERNKWRKKILNNACAIVLRDPISAKYVRKLVDNKEVYQTLDSAFQHDIDIKENKRKLNNYKFLQEFLNRHEYCVGVTITDLLWHPVHSKDDKLIQNIRNSFTTFLDELVEKGYGIVFIPQLYGDGNDYELMEQYMRDKNNYFILPDDDDRYDSYFQQYLISCLYAVIGMRYHSNIFSAKMSTPFVSISYEQKMQGFMEKMGLEEYCIKINELSVNVLENKFEKLSKEHNNYKKYLRKKHDEMRDASYETTKILKNIIEKI